MTRYTVTWHAEAEQELAAIWLSTPDRDGVTAAVRMIDVTLATHPETNTSGNQHIRTPTHPDTTGHAVAEGLRCLIIPPLRVLFVSHSHDCVAEVVFVREI
jgi:plasmid stabilization system protein ParE